MATERTSQLLAAFKKTSVLRGRDLTAMGFSRVLVADASKRGQIERIGRGLYTTKHADVSEKHSYVRVARMTPNAVLCLLSACRFHDLTTQNPHEVWFALGRKAWIPKITFVKTRIVRFSGLALTEGIELHKCEGTELKVYSVAKTIADLFRYRNKFGLDVALEALRDALHDRKCSVDELMRFARMRHVAKVIEPYLTAYLSQ
jgi:predicted transcriptional regulator of viral defense system